MSDIKVSICQFNSCEGDTCKLYDKCDHDRFKKSVPEPTVRTCPECGWINTREAVNCEKCDYPLQW